MKHYFKSLLVVVLLFAIPLAVPAYMWLLVCYPMPTIAMSILLIACVIKQTSDRDNRLYSREGK